MRITAIIMEIRDENNVLNTIRVPASWLNNFEDVTVSVEDAADHRMGEIYEMSLLDYVEEEVSRKRAAR